MIISILGKAGKDKEEKNLVTAYYNASKIEKESGNYYNSADFLLENYPNEKFFFLSTKEAKRYQDGLIDLNQSNIEVKIIEDNSLEDIYENVFEAINRNINQEIILDVTHGFRHQPISAIFASILNKFLNKDVKLKIIFAKQIEAFKKYEYIYLDNYIDITQLSLLLIGFIRTLNFVNTVEVEGLNTLAFEKFSKALLSNDFTKLESSYKNLIATITQAKNNPKFDHLKNLFESVEEVLKQFEDFGKKKIYEKYLILAELMFSKGYYLLSLTYLFEAIRLYCSYSFYNNNLIFKNYWKKTDMYKINSQVMSFITQKTYNNYRQVHYDKSYPNLYNENEKVFKHISDTYVKLRDIRNTLTHISSEKNNIDIKSSLKELLGNIKNIIEKDTLKQLKR